MGPPLWTLSVAESLTAGHLQAQLSSVSGASRYFAGGVTAYTLQQKVKLLGVNRQRAEADRCVSEGIALEMAQGAATLFATDLALATTGYAEPYPHDWVTVPFAYWALVQRVPGGGWQSRTGRLECPGANRVEVQAQVALHVVQQLVTYLSAMRAAVATSASVPPPARRRPR